MSRVSRPMKKASLLLLCCSIAACGDNEENAYPLHSCDDADITSANCIEIKAGDADALLVAANSLMADTTIVLGAGTYKMTNELNIQNVENVHVLGQGIDVTILDWKGVTAQVNGIAALNANGFLV